MNLTITLVTNNHPAYLKPHPLPCLVWSMSQKATIPPPRRPKSLRSCEDWGYANQGECGAQAIPATECVWTNWRPRSGISDEHWTVRAWSEGQDCLDLPENERADTPSTDRRTLRWWRFGSVGAVGTTSTGGQCVPPGPSILDDEVWRVYVRAQVTRL